MRGVQDRSSLLFKLPEVLVLCAPLFHIHSNTLSLTPSIRLGIFFLRPVLSEKEKSKFTHAQHVMWAVLGCHNFKRP